MDDQRVTDYLDRLRAAAQSLPDDRRLELVDDVRGHIEIALTANRSEDGTVVDTVLMRLGSPEEIVAAEMEPEPNGVVIGPVSSSSPADRRRPHATVEFKALALLTIGAVVLPFIGPLVALGYVWASARWTTVQKRTATIAVVGLLFLPAWLVVPMVVSAGRARAARRAPHGRVPGRRSVPGAGDRRPTRGVGAREPPRRRRVRRPGGEA